MRFLFQMFFLPLWGRFGTLFQGVCVGGWGGGWGWGLMCAITQLLISDERWSSPPTPGSWTSRLIMLMWGEAIVCVSSSQKGSPPWELASCVSCFWIFAIDPTSHPLSQEALPLLVVLLRPCSFYSHVSFLTGTRTLVRRHKIANLL